MTRAFQSLLLAVLVSATALAGCFAQNPDADEPVNLISRSFSVTVDSETARQLEGVEGPEDFIRALVDASLVLRVQEAADYTLVYTDADGSSRRESIGRLAPGSAFTVDGVDPFTAATLLKGDAKVAERGAIVQSWWQVGEVPLPRPEDLPQ